MTASSDKDKRIAKNTIMLYIRMLLIMAVTLYTSRIVLMALGVEDFGIYNVVGGIVIMFGFLNSAMTTATQRFLSFELGLEKKNELKKTFQIALNIHIGIAVVIFIIAETVGLWILNNKLNIPYERMEAAHWVYQCSILSFLITVLRVPYNASIISRERMNIYAYMSIIESILKLGIVFLLSVGGYDKLKLYSILLLIVTFIIAFFYYIYCRCRFAECRFSLIWDRKRYCILLSYAGWNLFGSLAWAGYAQGINILLNIFFGPVVNTARAISFQVNSAILSFISNFQVAVTPQIVKSYALQDIDYMLRLVFYASKYSFLLLAFLSLPLLLEMEMILELWLKQTLPYAALFCRLIIINSLIDTFSGTLMMAAQATGKIKKYQLIVGGLLLLNLPISYLFLSYEYPPESVYCVSILLSFIALVSRLFILRTLLVFEIGDFFKKVFFISIVTVVIAAIIPTFIWCGLEKGLVRLFFVTIASCSSFVLATYWIGFTHQERFFVKGKMKILINKLR